MFHAISDQLARLDLTLKTPSELRSSVIQYLRNSPLTSDGTHLREFISYQDWESYLRRMPQDGVWGDWITLRGLVNMLNIDIYQHLVNLLDLAMLCYYKVYYFRTLLAMFHSHFPSFT